jgi:hypothetical protein
MISDYKIINYEWKKISKIINALNKQNGNRN